MVVSYLMLNNNNNINVNKNGSHKTYKLSSVKWKYFTRFLDIYKVIIRFTKFYVFIFTSLTSSV